MRYRLATLVVLLLFVTSSLFALPRNESFKPPTPEELAMTSVPFAPGAPAVILQWSVYRDDPEGYESEYVRIKILNEEGKKYGEIELPYIKGGSQIADIKARTIRPDGKIVNFDGKIYDKKIVKARGFKVNAKAFAMPDVQVGSILEYRFVQSWDNRYVYNSSWTLQRELPIVNAKVELERYQGVASYFSYAGLPQGKAPVAQGEVYELSLQNIPQFQSEKYAPPEEQIKPRVQFFYSNEPIKTVDDFWDKQGKESSKSIEKFIGKPGDVQKQTMALFAPADTNEQKIRKIYDRVSAIKNLSYSASKTEQEQKRLDIRDNRSADDVLKNGYGYHFEISRLFVAMARAAGFESDVVLVGERDDYIFQKDLANPEQLNGEVLVVKFDGKELFLDPGTPTAPYGLLSWEYTAVPGMRLKKKESPSWVQTPAQPASMAVTQRRADLHLEEGLIKGQITVVWNGQEALSRRIQTMNEDEAARKKTLEDEIKGWLPEGATVKLKDVKGLAGGEDALTVISDIEVPNLASEVGSRTLLPLSVFQVSQKNPFAPTKRQHPIYYPYPFEVQDEIKFTLGEDHDVETMPKATELDLKTVKFASSLVRDGQAVTLKRNFSVAAIQFEATSYPALRGFYGKVAAADGESLVLKKK